MPRRAVALAVVFAFAVNVGAFMVGAACLPDLTAARVAPLDAGALLDTAPVVVPAQCGDGVIDLKEGEECEASDSGAFGCTGCRVSCEDGGLLDDTSGHCYFLAEPSGSYKSAGVNCQNHGAHVVTFVSEAEYARVLGWAVEAGAPGFWIGLNFDLSDRAYKPQDGVNEPGWSRSCDGCYAHLDAGANNFPAPRDGGGSRSCVGAGSALDEPWYSIPCDFAPSKFTAPVVCEREPVGSTAHPCIGGTCTSVRGPNGGRYLYVGTPAPAQEAFDACASIDAKLVVFETREEREALWRELLSFLGKSPVPQVWIGLTRAQGIAKNGQWTWADGKPVGKYPLQWAEQQPKIGALWAFTQFPPVYDAELSSSDDGNLRLPYVCEL